MKVLVALIIVFILAGFSHEQAQERTPSAERITVSSRGQSKSDTAKNKMPVLVELFTSEGCPTCPPAEKVLAFLQTAQPNPEAEIITLALHVDYWNRGGWTDRFSSPLFSQRQEIYKDKFKAPAVYTPQMVVDGSRYFVGSNTDEARKAISQAAKEPKANIEIFNTANNLKIKITDIPKHENAAVFMAIAEDDLVTEVSKGENGGLTLKHSAVVRQLKPLGRLLSTDNHFEIEATLDADPQWKKQDLKFVVFLQEIHSRKILGVAKFLLDK